MKLIYKDIVVGALDEVNGEMGREYGKLTLSIPSLEEGSEEEQKLVKYINLHYKLEEAREDGPDDEDYENDAANRLCEELENYPDFIAHKEWKLLYEETGKTEKINVAQFVDGRVFWAIDVSEWKSDELIFGLTNRTYIVLVFAISIVVISIMVLVK